MSKFKVKDKDRLTKIHLETNVFEETMKRLEIIYAMYDEIFISFSGGKDSLLCLKLFELYQKANGITKKLNVIFYDEELVDSYVLQYVEKMMKSGKYNFQWWCAPLESEKYILGKKEVYIQWDENREHIREIPEWALTCSGVRKQEEMWKEYTKGYTGKIAVILGLRTDESLNRLRGIFATRNKLAYINSETKNVSVVKPIYDWSEKDLFRFFYEYGVEYCDTYERQIFNGERLRVSTPLHAEAAKTSLVRIKSKDPVLYNQMINIFPEIELQIRYYSQYKKQTAKKASYEKYERSWAGVIEFARDVVPDELIDTVVKKIIYAKRSRKRYEKDRPLGGYPLLYMFQEISVGRYKRMIPMLHTAVINKIHYDFENLEYDNPGSET